MTNRPFRFGVQCWKEASSAEWVKKAQRAEKLGYSTLLLPDHVMTQIAAIPTMMFVAAVTKTLRVSSFVLNNDLRHPILLAKEAATLDLLSNGRLELAIGAGWNKPEYDAMGISFDRPHIRVSRMEEAVQIIKELFHNPSVNFSGQFYTVKSGKGLDNVPQTVQKPHPPILIGGGGRRLLSFAAREADIIGLIVKVKADGSGVIYEDMVTLPQKVEWIRDAAGARLDDIELNVQVFDFELTDNRLQKAAELADPIPVSAEDILESPFYLLGSVDQIIEQIKMNRGRYGISYYVTSERNMEKFAPIVARLTGK